MSIYELYMIGYIGFMIGILVTTSVVALVLVIF